MNPDKSLPNLKSFIDAIATLRGPNGCPWDKEQDHKSLKKYLLNESYELLDAIDSEDKDEICEELGDVLLQVILHSQIGSENGHFDIEKVAQVVRDKIIHRHPHVFADTIVANSDEVVYNWEQIKSKEKPERESVLDGVPKSAPALMQAEMLSKKAVSIGFEWPNENMLWDTFYSEIAEFKEAKEENNKYNMENELGDMLFCIVNIARWHKIDPEMALKKANAKFVNRFKHMESNVDKQLTEYTQLELEELWQNAKKDLDKR